MTSSLTASPYDSESLPPVRALVLVDIQNDFCEGGSLAVQGGAGVAAAVTAHLDTTPYEHVVATRDAHIDPGRHFADVPDYETTWPAHCVLGTPGAELHPALDRTRIEATFDKGAHEAAFSGFEGAAGGQSLADWLRERGVTEVHIVGIATDFCVRATAIDAVRNGFAARVLLDLTAGISPETTDTALRQMRQAGVELLGEPVVLSS